MKKLNAVLLMLMVVFVSCSTSKEDKAKKLIESRLKVSMHDFKSYEFVEISDVDSLFTKVEDTSEFILLTIESDENLEFMEEANEEGREIIRRSKTRYDLPSMEEINAVTKKLETARDNSTEIADKMFELWSNYVPEHNGWKADFTFRGKNASGNLIIKTYEYKFNLDMTEIISQSGEN